MYVLMASHGEYSDRSVWTIGYTANEKRAKELVAEYTKLDQLKISIESAKIKLRTAFIVGWDSENPYPIMDQTNIEKPVFDQDRHKDKQYVAEHTERKRAFAAAHGKYVEEIVRPWYAERDEAANAYVEANFTMELCKPPEWTDNQYWYEEIKELL